MQSDLMMRKLLSALKALKNTVFCAHAAATILKVLVEVADRQQKSGQLLLPLTQPLNILTLKVSASAVDTHERQKINVK